jgi:hypothetical protein
MSTRELRDLLAARAEIVDDPRPEWLDEVHARIRSARRRRAGAVGVAAVGLVTAAVVATTVLTGADPGNPQPIDPVTPSPTPTVVVPDGQATAAAQVDPSDIRGWRLLGRVTNDEPGHRGDTDLSLTYTPQGIVEIEYFCRGDRDTWLVREARGGGGMAPCSPDDSADELQAPQILSPVNEYGEAEQRRTTYRIFVARVPAAQQACVRGGEREDCTSGFPPLTPLPSTEATFGLAVHDHRAPDVVHWLGRSFEALNIVDGTAYVVDRAVFAAEDAPTLVVPLEASTGARIVSVLEAATPAGRQCFDAVDQRLSRESPEWKACAPDLVLRVDGRVPEKRDPDGYNTILFGWPWTVVPPGSAHEVTVDVTTSQPRYVRFLVVIWEEQPAP